MSLQRGREFWEVASGFPQDKEKVYPEHTVVQRFDHHRGDVVVEYGCGGGSDTESWARRGNAVRAFDIVPLNVETTRSRLAASLPTADVQVTLLENSAPLPLDDGCVDVVSSHGVVHHIAPPTHKVVMAEFARVLRPGGLLYIMLYTEHLHDRLAERRADQESRGLTPFEAFGALTDGGGCPYARPYTEAQAIEFIESVGLEVVATDVWNNGDFRTLRALRP